MNSAALEPKVVVYKATNLVNGHWYVGFTTKGLTYRERMHRYHRSNASLLRHAINKHGQENFVFEMLADFDGDEELAKLYEREMIEKYRPEYNLNYGGDGGTTHPDTRRKISEANKGRAAVFKGRKFSEEALEKFRATKARNGKPAPMTGKKMLPHVKEALRVANLGKPSAMKGRSHTPEALENMRRAAKTRKRYVHTAEHRAALAEGAKEFLRKPVMCLDDGITFYSATEAAKYYGLRVNSVSRVAAGARNSAAGRRFVYIEKT